MMLYWLINVRDVRHQRWVAWAASFKGIVAGAVLMLTSAVTCVAAHPDRSLGYRPHWLDIIWLPLGVIGTELLGFAVGRLRRRALSRSDRTISK